jgi:GNAT superfamily N-acetyltransferase
MVEIRKAAEAEKPALLDIWIDKSVSMERKGIRVWSPGQFTLENLREKYVSPEYYLGKVDGETFGAFILIEKDERYWPGNRDKAYYFHKFVVADRFAGQGYSKIILDWVKGYGNRNGKSFIRLDFNEDRDYLKKLYYGNCFVKVKEFEKNEKHTLVLAEFRIAEGGR